MDPTIPVLYDMTSGTWSGYTPAGSEESSHVDLQTPVVVTVSAGAGEQSDAVTAHKRRRAQKRAVINWLNSNKWRLSAIVVIVGGTIMFRRSTK